MLPELESLRSQMRTAWIFLQIPLRVDMEDEQQLIWEPAWSPWEQQCSVFCKHTVLLIALYTVLVFIILQPLTKRWRPVGKERVL